MADDPYAAMLQQYAGPAPAAVDASQTTAPAHDVYGDMLSQYTNSSPRQDAPQQKSPDNPEGTAHTFTVDPRELDLEKIGLGAPNAGLIPASSGPAKTDMPTAAPGVQMGLADPVVGAAQLAAHAAAPIAPSAAPAMDKFVQQREQEYQGNNNPSGIDWQRIAGNAVGTLPISYAVPGAGAATLLPRIASGAGSGLATALMQPTDVQGNDYWSQKAKQGATGFVSGGVAPVALGGLARVISPNVSPDVAALMREGVTPTPGQILGGSANRIEEAAQSIPLVGDTIKNARTGAVEQFNRAAINRALSPIGESLSEDTPLGREAITEANQKVSDAYDKLVPTLTVKTDPNFVSAVNNLQSGAQTMAPDRAAQFNAVLNNDILSKFSPSGGMTGETFKETESKLGSLASNYSNSSSADERQLGGAFKQLQMEMRGLLTRSNPDQADQLSSINNAYGNLLRVQGAAARIGSDQGVFTPAQLLSSTRQLDPSLRKGAFARGDAMMQDLADAGKSVLGNKVPDSGTPLRSAVMAAGALGPLYMASPVSAVGLGSLGAGTMAAYSPVGRKIAAALLASRPDIAPQAASGVRALAPAASTVLPLIASGQ